MRATLLFALLAITATWAQTPPRAVVAGTNDFVMEMAGPTSPVQPINVGFRAHPSAACTPDIKTVFFHSQSVLGIAQCPAPIQPYYVMWSPLPNSVPGYIPIMSPVPPIDAMTYSPYANMYKLVTASVVRHDMYSGSFTLHGHDLNGKIVNMTTVRFSMRLPPPLSSPLNITLSFDVFAYLYVSVPGNIFFVNYQNNQWVAFPRCMGGMPFLRGREYVMRLGTQQNVFVYTEPGLNSFHMILEGGSPGNCMSQLAMDVGQASNNDLLLANRPPSCARNACVSAALQISTNKPVWAYFEPLSNPKTAKPITDQLWPIQQNSFIHALPTF